MATLENSLRLKASGVKGPAKSGTRLLNEPELVLEEGKSGGIAASKKLKNAGSTNPVVPKNSPGTAFVQRMGAPVLSDKTGGYF